LLDCQKGPLLYTTKQHPHSSDTGHYQNRSTSKEVRYSSYTKIFSVGKGVTNPSETRNSQINLTNKEDHYFNEMRNP